MIADWQTTSSERCTWDTQTCARPRKSSVSSLRAGPRLSATTKKRIPTVQAAGLVDEARGTAEVAEVVVTGDGAEDGNWLSFSPKFLVFGSGLLHSAGVLYVQVGEDTQIRWEATAMCSIYPCLLIRCCQCRITSQVAIQSATIPMAVH